MPEQTKVFPTPIPQVKFVWENGQDQTIQQVVERKIYGDGSNMLVVVKTEDGAFVAVRGFVQMEQAPAVSFF